MFGGANGHVFNIIINQVIDHHVKVMFIQLDFGITQIRQAADGKIAGFIGDTDSDRRTGFAGFDLFTVRTVNGSDVLIQRCRIKTDVIFSGGKSHRRQAQQKKQTNSRTQCYHQLLSSF